MSGKFSKMGLPDRPAKEISFADHPEVCTSKRSLWRYPKACAKSSCQIKRSTRAQKKEMRL